MNTMFVDTNVLVYARDARDEAKQQAAREWMRLLWRSRAGRVSTQVLQEFYVTATRKLDSQLGPAVARADVETLTGWNPLSIDPSLFQAAWDIEDRFGFSFWDSLVVAAALRTGCTYLLTEDLQDGQVLDGLTVVDPFSHAPDSFLG